MPLSQGFSDHQLAAAVRGQIDQGREIVFAITNKFRIRLFAADAARPNERVEIGSGDLGNETSQLLLEAAKKNGGLRWIDTEAMDLDSTAHANCEFQIIKRNRLRSWMHERDIVTGTTGRHTEIDPKIKFEVASSAAWRCQFEGCGEDLRQHFMPGRAGNYGYFAHIVASSREGPRGDAILSARLANDPTNIMLMCDKCHRLIDRISPDHYTVEVLSQMRSANVVEIRRLLDRLRYPTAQMLVIGGNIEGQSFAFDERLAEEAMWMQGLRATGNPECFWRNGGHLGASNSDAYWLSLFHLMKGSDLARLKALLNGTSGTEPRRRLAVFAVHGTSVLVLAGRLIGESSAVHLFQFHRDQIAGKGGGQWAWPDGPVPRSDKYQVRVHRPACHGDTEALLQVNLTARVPACELPDHIFGSSGYSIPAIEITVDECSHRVIGRPDDLELFGRALDLALAKLQDEWRINTVHLAVIAPITACIRIGQKMQARHQSDFILYEREPRRPGGTRAPFGRTVRISSTEVTLHSTGESISLS